MKDWAALLDRVLGNKLRRLVRHYQNAHPESVCRAWSHSLGEATIYQGCTVGAEFQLQNGTLQFVVDLAYLDWKPGFERAEVCWTGPERNCEAAWPRSVRIGTAEEQWRQHRIPRLKKGLPRLYKALKRALARGQPPPPPKPRKNVHVVDFPPMPETVEPPLPPANPGDGPVCEAVLARLGGRRMNPDLGFGLDRVRIFQAGRMGWNLPDELPGEARRIDGYRGHPRIDEWREIYRKDPDFRGGIFLSRVAFVSDQEAYICVRRRLGFGDSGYWANSRSWNGNEIPWRERWDAPNAMEICDLVRLQRQGRSWQVTDALDLLGPVPGQLQMEAVRESFQAGFRMHAGDPSSKLAMVVVAEIDLYRVGGARESHPESLTVDAVMKDGRTLRFTVLTFSLSFTRPMGPIERVIVVNGAHPTRIVQAIEAWLKISEG